VASLLNPAANAQIESSLAEATATFAVLEEEAGRPSGSTTFKQIYEDAMSKISELAEDMELARKILDDPSAPMSDQDREEREVRQKPSLSTACRCVAHRSWSVLTLILVVLVGLLQRHQRPGEEHEQKNEK